MGMGTYNIQQKTWRIWSWWFKEWKGNLKNLLLRVGRGSVEPKRRQRYDREDMIKAADTLSKVETNEEERRGCVPGELRWINIATKKK